MVNEGQNIKQRVKRQPLQGDTWRNMYDMSDLRWPASRVAEMEQTYETWQLGKDGRVFVTC